MNRFYNFTPDGKFYVSTSNPHGTGWETAVFKVNNKTGNIDFSFSLDDGFSETEDGAKAHHLKTLQRWSCGSHPEDILGIGEGFY